MYNRQARKKSRLKDYRQQALIKSIIMKFAVTWFALLCVFLLAMSEASDNVNYGRIIKSSKDPKEINVGNINDNDNIYGRLIFSESERASTRSPLDEIRRIIKTERQALENNTKKKHVLERYMSHGILNFVDEVLMASDMLDPFSWNERVTTDSKILDSLLRDKQNIASDHHEVKPRSVAALYTYDARDKARTPDSKVLDKVKSDFNLKDKLKIDRRVESFQVVPALPGNIGNQPFGFYPNEPEKIGHHASNDVNKKRPNDLRDFYTRKLREFFSRDNDRFGLPGRPVKKFLETLFEIFAPKTKTSRTYVHQQTGAHFPRTSYSDYEKGSLNNGKVQNTESRSQGLAIQKDVKIGPLSVKLGLERQ